VEVYPEVVTRCHCTGRGNGPAATDEVSVQRQLIHLLLSSLFCFLFVLVRSSEAMTCVYEGGQLNALVPDDTRANVAALHCFGNVIMAK
jgi:hypothetical protein